MTEITKTGAYGRNPVPNLSLEDQATEFPLYTAPNGKINVEVVLSDETIWLTQ